MKISGSLLYVTLVASCLAITGCGSGGSGPVTSTPAPTPTTPPDVANLATDRSFSVASSDQAARFNLESSNTLTSRSTESKVKIDYKSSTDSYTLTSDSGRTVTFTPANKINPSSWSIKSSNGAVTETLTNASLNFRTKSVALGIWQKDTATGPEQNSDFNVFAYGFPSAAAAVPVSGSADFRTDVFGISSQVGREPVSIKGTGTTVFDFARGTFAMDTTFSEDFLFTRQGRFGALYFRAAGNLSSSSKALNGTFSFDGSGNTIAGLLNGNFFGPDAKEAGGTFTGDDGAGNTVVGGFIALSSGKTQSNLSVYGLEYDQLFYTGTADYEQRRYKNGTPGFVGASVGTNGQISFNAADGSYRVAGFGEDEGRYRPSDRINSAETQFDVYRINPTSGPRELAFYKPANGGEIQLTYSGFGFYRSTYEDALQFNFSQKWFLYGLDTLEGVLAGRSGSGTYKGVARGIAGSSDGARQFAVAGTSQFLIDFASQGYSGWLRLKGTDIVDGAQIDFGEFSLLQGTGFARNAFQTSLLQAGQGVGQIQLRFYGPTGEEMAGVFGVQLRDYGITGGTAAVRD